MIIDTQVQLSDAQSITASGNSSNIIDFGQTNSRMGASESFVVAITVDTALAGSTPNIRFQWRQDNSATPTTPVAYTQAYTTLAAGAQVVLAIPKSALGRYGVLYFEVVSGTVSAFAFTAQLCTDEMLNNTTIYPSGWVVN